MIYLAPYYSHSRTDGDKYLLFVMDTPSRWYLWRYRLYHYYDMRIPVKIPGWLRFERWLLKRFKANPPCLRMAGDDSPVRLVDRIAGWSTGQDFRCYQLSREHKKLGEIEITKEQYESVLKRWR